MSSAAVLTIHKDGEAVRTHAIEGEVDLGRAEGCVIRLDNRAISRQHAVFRSSGDGIQVEKRSEFAPLAVNGQECTRAILKDGDVVSIGPYLMKLAIRKKSRDLQPAPVTAAGVSPSQVTTPQSAPSFAELPEPEPLFADSPAGSDPAAPGGGLSGLITPEAQQYEQQAEPLPFEFNSSESPDVPPAMDLAAEPGFGLGDAEPFRMELAEGFDPGPIDPNAETKIADAQKIAVKLFFPAGAANFEEYDLATGPDEVRIGRGKECEVILNTKKASRIHAVVRRRGAEFSLQDMESANGTFVNGEKISEIPLAGDETIRIAGVEFRFRAVSEDYLKREKDILPLPNIEDLAAQAASNGEVIPNLQMLDMSGDPMQSESLMPAYPGVSGDALGMAVGPDPNAPGYVPFSPPPFGGGNVDPLGMPGMIPGITGTDAGKKMSLLEKYRALPPKRRVIWTVIIIGLLYFGVVEEDTPTKKPVSKKTAVTKKNMDGVRTFDQLNAEEKRFVVSQHALAFDHYKNKEYDKALYEIRKIFTLIPDFKDSKEIERYAMEGKRKLEALEEEKKRKEEEARLKIQVAQLLDEGAVKMKKRQYEQAKEVFYEILAIEPDNEQVAKWRAEIEAIEEEKRIQEQNRQVQLEINRRAWEFYDEGLAFKERGLCYDAISAFEKVPDVGPSDKKVLAKSKQMIGACHDYIRERREPVLAEAKQLEIAGSYAPAFALFQKATRIDPKHPDGFAGMERIRGILHERARVLYAEAVLSESYSDFDVAKKKYRECIAVAPEDDVYHERAKRKLANFFRKEGESPIALEGPSPASVGGATP